MSNIIYFYDPANNFKRNIPLFLLKEGFKVSSTNTIEEVEAFLNRKETSVIVLDNESNAFLVSRITTLPLVLILNKESKLEETVENLKPISNPVFVRSELDSLDTIVNTISLGSRL